MHSVARKVLEKYLYLQECHLKQKGKNEVDIYLKVLPHFVGFQLFGMFSVTSVLLKRALSR